MSDATPPSQTPGQVPAPAYAAAPAASGKTNTLAIVALILGIVIPIGGIICGPIALSQIKQTGEGGRGLAIAGIIIGAVLIVLGIIFGIIGIVVGASVGASTLNQLQ